MSLLKKSKIIQKVYNIAALDLMLKSKRFSTSISKSCTLQPIYKNYRITGSGIGSHCNIVTHDDWKLSTDVTTSQGGTNKAAQPVLLLLASLAGCELATARYVAFKSNPRIVMGKIEFEINGNRDERGALHLPMYTEPPEPARLEHVWGSATVYDTNASQEQISALGAEVHRRCPIANMIILSGCRLDIDWKIANS